MRILTVVVTYNEASNIGRLIPAIQQQLPASSVLVVDDSSPDGTADIVRGLQARDPRIELMTRPAKRGYGSAAIAGMQYGISNGFDVIVTLDADFSHDPADLPLLVEALSVASGCSTGRYAGCCSVSRRTDTCGFSVGSHLSTAPADFVPIKATL